MSQYDFGNLESPLSGTVFFNTHLEPWRDALHSMHKGGTRPSYAVGGMIWVDDTTEPWELKMFNGTADDITLGLIDPTNLFFQPSGISQYAGSAGGTANAITLTPTIPWTAYDTGKPFECLITATNTSEDVTVNISALGTKAVKCSIGAGKVKIPKGALQSGMIARMVYDGTDLLLLNVRANNKSADIATASTLNLDNATGDYVRLTGTTTVTAITLAEGQERTCVCAAAFTLTDGSGNSPQGIILPGAANITTAAGDVFVVRGESNGTVRCVSYTKADGTALVSSTPTFVYDDYVSYAALTTVLPMDDTTPTSTEGTEVLSVSIDVPAGKRVEVEFNGFGACASSSYAISAALFRGTTCINVVGASQNTLQRGIPLNMKTVETPGAGTRTYSVRVGPSAAGSAYLNGDFTSRLFGGAAKATLTARIVD